MGEDLPPVKEGHDLIYSCSTWRKPLKLHKVNSSRKWRGRPFPVFDKKSYIERTLTVVDQDTNEQKQVL